MKVLSVRKQLVIGVIAAAALLAGVKAFTGSNPVTVGDLSDDIVDVQEWPQSNGAPVVGVFLRYDGAEQSYLSRVSLKMMEISEGILESWPNRYSEIIWFPQMVGIDKSGNERDVLTVKMSFQVSDLKDFNWNDASNLTFLNFAKIDKFGPFGQKVSVAFCSDDYQAARAQIFCLQVLDRLKAAVN